MVAGYKQTDIGLIPQDWEVKRLSEVGESVIGLTYSPANVKSNGTLVLRSSNVQNGKLSFDNNVYVDMDLPSRVIVKENDILICVRNGSRQLIGKCALIDKKTEGSAFGAFMSVYRSELSVYAFHQFQSNVIQRQINETLGATINQITNKDLARFVIPVPPEEGERVAIATALNDSDALVAKLEKLIAKKRAIKQGAMQELLKPKEGWERKSLHELSDNKKELFDDGDWIEAEHITSEGTRLIQTGNIGIGEFIEKENKKYIYEASFHKLKCKPLTEGDLLICRLAEPAGRACILPNIGESRIVTSVDVTIFRPRPEVANRAFLVNIFSTSNWFQQVVEKVGGTTHKRISRSSLGRIEISTPHIKEQNRIAEIFLDMDAEIETLESKLAKYKMIKQGMMQNLLTGRIRLV
jgi:type I restriction enzyme S subunit